MSLETIAGALYVCGVISFICFIGLAGCVVEWMRRERH